MKILTLTMLLKKIIKNISKEKKNIKIYGLATNSKKVKKDPRLGYTLSEKYIYSVGLQII